MGSRIATHSTYEVIWITWTPDPGQKPTSHRPAHPQTATDFNQLPVTLPHITRDPRLAKPGIARIIGDPPPRPDRTVERPHPEPSPQLHTTAVCIHDQVRPGTRAHIPGPSRLTCDPHAMGIDARGAKTSSGPIRMRRRTGTICALVCAGLPPPVGSAVREPPTPGARLACSPSGPSGRSLRPTPLPPCRSASPCRRIGTAFTGSPGRPSPAEKICIGTRYLSGSRGRHARQSHTSANRSSPRAPPGSALREPGAYRRTPLARALRTAYPFD